MGLLLDLDFHGLACWFIFGMYILETLVVAGLCTRFDPMSRTPFDPPLNLGVALQEELITLWF